MTDIDLLCLMVLAVLAAIALYLVLVAVLWLLDRLAGWLHRRERGRW